MSNCGGSLMLDGFAGIAGEKGRFVNELNPQPY
jgi:hypothetical protein